MSEAENGRVALARLAEARPDVIVLDLMMPEMDGFEFLDEMRQHARVARHSGRGGDRQGPDGGGSPAPEWRGRARPAEGTSARDELLAEVGPLWQVRSRTAGASSGGGIAMKILYVEDNEDNIYML